MYRVLIADDEAWIRKSLVHMIDWAGKGLELAGEASDGQEAFDLVAEDPPDILIADVRMPGYDGLHLAEKLLALNPLLQVVIVSGYDEFDYARRALRVNAIAYLLKPIDAVELSSALLRARKTLDLARENQDLRGRIPYLARKLASDVLERGDAASAARFDQWLMAQGWENSSSMALVLEFDRSGYDFGSFAQIVESLAEAQFGRKTRMILYEGKDSLAHGVATLSPEGPTREDYLRRLSRALTLGNVLKASIFAGDAATSSRELAASHRQAERMLETRTGSAQATTVPFPVELQKDLVASILLADEKRFQSSTEKVGLHFSETPEIPFPTIRVFFHSVVSDIIKSILDREHFATQIVEEGLDFCSRLYEYHDLPALTDWLGRYEQSVRAHLLLSGPINVRKVVDEVAKYLEQNLQEALSLNRVASLFRVNSSYLSTMFMKHKGIGFLEYLTRLRMGRARELLTDSDATVSSIAAQVGYEDVRYFGKVFKKSEGCMPSEFRRR